jgi:hypothetical protein
MVRVWAGGEWPPVRTSGCLGEPMNDDLLIFKETNKWPNWWAMGNLWREPWRRWRIYRSLKRRKRKC